ncbi:hypothetical protein [Alterisphingorhabdus coralli]|uniref:Uncharacterized protein n=1 Tax=Alterisphingorhabdus coralli TaxID=3071408 RepID=A0AA97F9B4_9SPHN|nr:hypothetical protein [Parasphingorhabdus sp. SCSIO 66989]WOE76348.1 hypothetical protein RB602_06445 [Parasphingorhabdus sp. SCSIO 66989]
MSHPRKTDAVITRTINRFERAVEDKAFEGTVPWDSDEAIEEHERIDREYERSRLALERLIRR